MTMEFLPARAAILTHLRHVPSAKYSELRRTANMESDAFKFHVRYLVEQGIIAKQTDGTYSLTSAGKEIANNLNESAKQQLKQPKLSLLMVATRQTDQTTEYLVQQRKRQPFYGYWGLLSGPAQWGQDFEATAAHEFQKQTGFAGICTARTFLRQKDFAPQDQLLEDKLFIVMHVEPQNAEPVNTWPHGTNAWMTLPQILAEPHHFAGTEQAIEACKTRTPTSVITHPDAY